MAWGDQAAASGHGQRVTGDGEVLADNGAVELMSEAEPEQTFDKVIMCTKRDPKLWMEIDAQADPYLTSDGVDLIATVFHIDMGAMSWDAPERTGEYDENDDEIVGYTCRVTARRRLRDGSVRTCSADGQAFSDSKQIVALRRKGSLTKGGRLERTKDMAAARAKNRAVTRLLGTRAITWDDLDKRGITRDLVKRRDDDKQRGGSGGGRGGSSPDKDFLWAVFKGEVSGLNKNALGEATTATLGEFKKINDMTPDEIARVATALRNGGQPLADRGPLASPEQGDRFFRLVKLLNLNGEQVLEAHGHDFKGDPTEAVAAASILALEEECKRKGIDPKSEQITKQADIPF